MDSRWNLGFLSKVERLPSSFELWESIANDLPTLLKDSGKQLIDKVDRLPLITIDESSLPTEQHWKRAYCVITFISQAYRSIGQCTSLPRELAVPLVAVSSHLGLSPSPCYAAFVLWNWHLKNPSEPLSKDNFEIALSFTGSKDEAWFYLIHMRIELAAAPGIKAVIDCIEAIKKDDQQEVMRCLKIVTDCISSITGIMKEMYYECDPSVFYNKLRSFFSGSKEGIQYEGTEDPDTFRTYPGASGVQSSIIPLFDIFLGIEFEGGTKSFLDGMKVRMPLEHRQFLTDMKNEYKKDEFSHSILRTYVELHSCSKDTYNSCVKALVAFRQEHIDLVTNYILKPSNDTATEGTGGSTLEIFLTKTKEKTKSFEL
ncbi:PREDICTED: indoleamine 2,3-dioxygenase 1-like [Amphimedon queenslandica]|uniref:Indoleamine 2,3-dioxygenase n=2 Tax=Amphimedon queenslandica TaxID=400682 RepID=A0AAN0IML1_AMPQE|nr:PREDICTED: indoleamine 2,3-dioxygenase 1-like [Amphimedon queenslandica]|eukprot:XP_011404257.1 PREDICTED: indoleamine 2,3-dioxygenase 1-like [Amphimedon queenslandica]